MTGSWGDQQETIGGLFFSAADEVREKAARRADRCASIPDGLRRLHAAMLNNALRDLTSSATSLRREAWQWVEIDHNIDYPFSFHSVCDSLGLSVSAVRRQVRQHGASLVLRNLRRLDGAQNEAEAHRCGEPQPTPGPTCFDDLKGGFLRIGHVGNDPWGLAAG